MENNNAIDRNRAEIQKDERYSGKNNEYLLKFLIIVGVILLVVVLFRFDFTKANSSIESSLNTDKNAIDSISANAVTQTDGSVQAVKMYVQNGQYVLEPSAFKVGVPVRIEADISRMPGCAKSVMIPAFNVRKSLSQGSNTIEFTPTKSGTFNIACTMNMYKGSFTVLEQDGTKAAYAEPASASRGGCGGGCGGCGG